jgi:choline dehydrogenase
MYIRGVAADFDGWAAAGNRGWDYASLLPHFRAGECNSRGADHFHGADGALHISDPLEPHPLDDAFLRAGREIGLPANPDFNGERLDGVGRVQLTQRNGARCTAADSYLTKRPNLALMTNTTALRLVMEGRRATGVMARRGESEQRVLARREVLLCGGAINSPQLLMLSGIGPAQDLQRFDIPVVHDLPGVGRHLHDHLVTGLWAGIRTNNSMLTAESIANLLRFLLFRRGVLTGNAAQTAAFVRSRPDLPAPDIELVFVPVLFQGQGLEKPKQHGLTIGIVGLQPESRGTIRLASNDPLAKPVIDPNYLNDPRDLEVLRTGTKIALKLIGTKAMQSVVSGVIDPTDTTDHGLDAHIRSKSHTIYHPVGTCRMGPDPLSVVGSDLAVHGLSGLRVVDASIMPRIIRGHPQAATIAIAERAAALVIAAERGERARAA